MHTAAPVFLNVRTDLGDLILGIDLLEVAKGFHPAW